MPIYTIGELKAVEPNYVHFQKKYWPVVTQMFYEKHGENILTDASIVQEVLLEHFKFFCDKFMDVLNSDDRASFFLFVHYLHEDSIELYRMQLVGEDPAVKIDFAAVRRVLKYVLEQGCHMKMKGHQFYFREICDNHEAYLLRLEELLYIGIRAMELVENIAKSKISPKAISLAIHESEFTVYTNPPYNSLYKFVYEDSKKHSSKVEVSKSMNEFKQVVSNEVGINYDKAVGFSFGQIGDKRQRFGSFDLDQLIDMLHDSDGYPKDALRIFYKGMMVTNENALSIGDCILKTQHLSRYMYRPILRYAIDGKDRFFTGAHKWLESLSQVSTNCIPFGQYPPEWNELPPLKKFMEKVQNTHDRILEDPAFEIIQNAGWKVDRNIKNLKKPKNRNLSVVKPGIGEFDMIFLDETEKMIYIAECKHNRSRFEYYNWARDTSNFVETYEKQLNNKFHWIEQNIAHVLEHFEELYKVKISDKEKYSVLPLFMINAPTLYMYDSDYLVLTLYDLELFIKGEYIETVFNGQINGKDVQLTKPYFKNAANLLSNS